ncbi:MAG: phage late control D family protein [Shimia sp.]
MSITVVDEIDDKSDRLDLTFDNRDHRIPIPREDASIELALGFREGGLTRIGSYRVDKVSGNGWPATLTVGAKAGDMRASLKGPRSRSYEGMALGDIAAEVAGRHGLTPIVSDDLVGHRFAYLAQAAESDLHFLTRIARQIDATVKPVDGRLLVARRGAPQNADGSEKRPVGISRSDLTSWSWEVNGRMKFGTARATWSDRDTATVRSVEAGDAEPVIELRHRFPTEAEAHSAARAALDRTARASGTCQGDLARFSPALYAGGRIDVAGVEDAMSGVWDLTRVEHRLDGGGLITSFAAERDNEAAE